MNGMRQGPRRWAAYVGGVILTVLVPAIAQASVAPVVTMPPVVRDADQTSANENVTIAWTHPGFAQYPQCPLASSYEVSIDGNPQTISLNESARSVQAVLANGPHTVAIIAPQLVPAVSPPCEWDTFDQPKGTASFVVDGTAPTLRSVVINSGAQYTSSRDVLVSLDASDANGVRAAQLAPASDGFGGAVPFAPDVPYALPEGADGPRTVVARVRDTAQVSAGSPLTDGNESPVGIDTIFLDRVAPTARVASTGARVARTERITFDGSDSSDGRGGEADSGIDYTTLAWDFGDGTTARGVAPSHVYLSTGSFTGRLTVRDRAGNTDSAPFTVTVLPRGGSSTRTPGNLRYRFRYTTRPARLSFTSLTLTGLATGSNVQVRCRQRCGPTVRRTATRSSVALETLMRSARLAAGSQLEVRVTRAGATGWLTRLAVVRKGRELDVVATRCTVTFPKRAITSCRRV